MTLFAGCSRHAAGRCRRDAPWQGQRALIAGGVISLLACTMLERFRRLSSGREPLLPDRWRELPCNNRPTIVNNDNNDNNEKGC